MTFDIRNIWAFEVAGVEVWITETMLVTWIIMLALTVFAVIVRIRLKNFTDIPRGGFQNFIESVVEMFDSFVRGTAGPRFMFLGGWFFSVFAFIFVSNLSGALGFRPPTADWSMTIAIAMVTFTLIQVVGLRYRGAGYLKGFLKPVFIFAPLNIIGELARPVSLSFRLFGNILAGIILMGVVYNLAPLPLTIGLPAALHGYFDIAIGFLQTYIFCALSLAFISGAADDS